MRQTYLNEYFDIKSMPITNEHEAEYKKKLKEYLEHPVYYEQRHTFRDRPTTEWYYLIDHLFPFLMNHIESYELQMKIGPPLSEDDMKKYNKIKNQLLKQWEMIMDIHPMMIKSPSREVFMNIIPYMKNLVEMNDYTYQ